MKKIISLLKRKDVIFPLALFISGLVAAFIAKKYIGGVLGNGITVFGCLTTMTATDLLARTISAMKMQQMEEKKMKK